MSARPSTAQLATTHLAPLLKEHGWAKKALTWTRRRGDTTQVINLQNSHGGKSFYVNIGMVIDAVEKLGGNNSQQGMGTYTVTYGERLDGWRRGMPQEFPANEVDTVGPKIRNALEKLMPTLDALDSPAAFRENLDLGRGFYKILRAQLAWLAGDKKAAKKDLEAVVKEFGDRPAVTYEWAVKHAGLKGKL